MIEIQNTKMVIMLPPQLKKGDDFDGNTYVDTQGYNHLRVLFIVGTLDAPIRSYDTGIAPKIRECDTTDGSYTDVTDAALANVIAADEDDSLFAIDIDLMKSHKRYMEVYCPNTSGGTTGANLAIIGQLSRADIGPVNAAGQGLTEHIKA